MVSDRFNFDKFELEQLLYKCNCRIYICSLIQSLSSYVGSEAFNAQTKGNGCALAWATMACRSESELQFNLVEQFPRIYAGH